MRVAIGPVPIGAGADRNRGEAARNVVENFAVFHFLYGTVNAFLTTKPETVSILVQYGSMTKNGQNQLTARG